MCQGCGCRDNPEKVEKWGKKMMRTGTFITAFIFMFVLTLIFTFDVSASSMSADGADLSAAQSADGSGLSAAPAADTFSDKEKTVRVGYFYNGDFMHKEDDGSYAGYDVEYYYTLAGYAGWEIEFVDFESLKDALAALKSGEIDILSGLSVTEERKQSYLIADQKMCTTHIAVQTRADDDRYTVGDVSAMKDLTCGILKGSNVVALYSEWCEKNGLTPHIVEYNDLKSRNAAFAAGEVDAVAAGSTVENAQKIAEFPGLDLYFMLNADDSVLKAELDHAMEILALQDSTYALRLYQSYFPLTKNTYPSFSKNEKDFIVTHAPIRIAVLKDDAPFSSVQSDGSVSGILTKYFQHIGEIIGAKIEFVPYGSKDAACAALKNGEVDAVGKDESDIFDANERNIILSNVYLRMSMVQITKAGATEVNTAAVPECSIQWVNKALRIGNSPVVTVSFNNCEACFKDLKAGKADSVICTQPAATWILNRNRASDYVVSSFGMGTWDVSCAFDLSDDGNTLRSIVNKTIAVDEGYISQLITTDTLEDSADLSGFIERLPISSLIALAAGALALFAISVFALFIIIRRRAVEKRLAAQQAVLHEEMEISKARHAFFGTVSHDMRTPLNGIVGFTDLALQSGDMGTIRQYLTKIRYSGTILSNLVNDTLIMSRLENGTYVLHPEVCDTSTIFRGIVEPIGEMADKKGVCFIDRTSGRCNRKVITDRLSLQKVFLNLLSNAVKFTPAGGTVMFSCSSSREGRDGSGAYGQKEGRSADRQKECGSLGQAGCADGENNGCMQHGDGSSCGMINCTFVVSDTGIGISREFMPHIFEAFSQENPNNSESAGSGMGLSIVRNIVDAMGGNIRVESTVGKGTVFTVCLRFEEVQEETAAEAFGKAAVSGQAEASGKTAASGQAEASGKTAASGQAEASGKTAASGQAEASGKTAASGQAEASGKTAASGQAEASGKTAASDQADVSGKTASGQPAVMNTPRAALVPEALKKHVLVCEDNALNMEILCAILKKQGMEVTQAVNGREGVNYFAGSAPGYYDAVLMDIRMPVMNGCEATEAIRVMKRSDAASVPIFAVSADAYKENEEECLACGMNGHISKPVDADKLVKTLNEAMSAEFREQ